MSFFLLVAYAAIAIGLILAGIGWTLLDRSKLVLITGFFWLAYGGWEYLVQIRTPEANIRVDLLLVVPILLILTIASLIAIIRKKAGV